jgi:hypothetical protein
MKSKPTRANPRRSEPVTNKPNEELEMGVSGEQNKVGFGRAEQRGDVGYGVSGEQRRK